MNAMSHLPSLPLDAVEIATGTRHSPPSAMLPHDGPFASHAVESIDTPEALAAWGPRWRELEERSGNTLPFRTHEWAQTWWKHFHEDRPVVKDSLYMRAVRNPTGELIAIAPLMLTERPALGPLRIRGLQFLGPDSLITELGGLLSSPEHEADAYGALLAHLHANRTSWDWIAWNGLQPGGASARAVESAGHVQWTGQMPNYVLPLAPTWDEFRARLPRNIKESLRKCYNAPKRCGLQFSFHIARDPAEIQPALEEFFRLHSARARLDGTVPHRDVFRSTDAHRFLTDVCYELSRRGATRIFALRCGGQTVATRIGFVLGEALYLYYSGYDPEFRSYSVMTTTVAEAIRHAIREGVRSVNLSMGKDVSKTRWGPQEIVYAEAVQLSSTARARLSFWVHRQARHALALPGVRDFASRYLWRHLH
jgi:CelD/BcsL family acetyltransferase involved in cellulose biosynthesis